MILCEAGENEIANNGGKFSKYFTLSLANSLDKCQHVNGGFEVTAAVRLCGKLRHLLCIYGYIYVCAD
jgi:hypothetical protein